MTEQQKQSVKLFHLKKWSNRTHRPIW